jgi:2-oxoisovalerate dehydrogenase E1 component alpha subunit
VDQEANEIGARVRNDCLTMPDPKPLTIFENVYAEPNAQLDYERDQFAAYLDSFSGEEVGA